VAEKAKPKNCKNCGKEFIPCRAWQVFCDTPCRVENWRKNHPTITPQELAEIKQKLNIK
jgi:hypothetical protein